MERLLDWSAPRSAGDLVVKAVAFLVLINLVNLASTVARGSTYLLGDDLCNTTAVALPFILFHLAVLRRQRRLQARLVTLATTDATTGLPNRRDFLARARRAADGGGALILLDADHFKGINDAFGHAAGDACLAAIAHRLRAALRPGDLVGRIGGEEFAAFLPGAGSAEARAVGERLCRSIAVQVSQGEAARGEAARGEAARGEVGLAVTLSAGAAIGDGALPLDRLMIEADRALYAAKAQGRACLVMWPAEEPSEGEAAAGPPAPSAGPIRAGA